jgi:nitrogen fixation protein NifU and related proteins
MTNVNSYSKKVLEHFRNPHNYGQMKNPTSIGEVGNIVCGDVMKLYIKIVKDKITDIKFETFGCAAAIATSSVITDLVKGKTIEEALRINKDDIIKSLEELPPIKIHCSLLSVDALKEAIYSYLIDQKRSIPEELKKVHEKNIKEREFVENKHSDWVEAEKSC